MAMWDLFVILGDRGERRMPANYFGHSRKTTRSIKLLMLSLPREKLP